MDNLVNLGYECFVYDGQTMYFSEYETNGLYKTTIDSNIAEFVTEFPNEKDRDELYRCCLLKDGKIYFAPYMANEIAIYDIDLGKMKKLPIIEPKEIMGDFYSDAVELANMPIKFAGIYEWKKYVFMIGLKYPAIIRLNTDTYKIEYITNPVKKMLFGNKIKAVDLIMECGGQNGNILFVSSRISNYVLKFDMESLDADLINIPASCGGFSGMLVNDYELWMTTKGDEKVVRYNLNSASVKEFALSVDEDVVIHRKKAGIRRPVLCDGKIIIVPYAMECVWMIDAVTDEVTNVTELKNIIGDGIKYPVFPNIFINAYTRDKKLIILSGYDMAVLEYDFTSKSLEKCYLKCISENCTKKRNNDYGIIQELDVYNLSDYIEYINKR